MTEVLDFILHLNKHLDTLAGQYGLWIYAILFLIVFCETGLVVTPFLPGDSLLFAAGAVAAGGALNVFVIIALLVVAAVLGDSVNYWLGDTAGHKLIRKYPRLIKQQYLEKTHDFFERYGGKTIIIARFVPIVRTFAPFVAGIGEMTYARFMSFNVVGALLWVLLLVPAGYFFANVPFVKENFSMVILAIIILSILPGIYEVWRERRAIAAGRR
jgi:membrane-associated protein